MTPEENELTFVKFLPTSGLGLWKRETESGGFEYWGESNGCLARLYDESIGSQEEFLAIAEDCYNLTLESK